MTSKGLISNEPTYRDGYLGTSFSIPKDWKVLFMESKPSSIPNLALAMLYDCHRALWRGTFPWYFLSKLLGSQKELLVTGTESKESSKIVVKLYCWYFSNAERYTKGFTKEPIGLMAFKDRLNPNW